MYVSMYVCMYVYIYTHKHTYIHTYIGMYVCVCVCIHTHTHVCVCVCNSKMDTRVLHRYIHPLYSRTTPYTCMQGMPRICTTKFVRCPLTNNTLGICTYQNYFSISPSIMGQGFQHSSRHCYCCCLH